ncbi:exodeoxyribonuclease VII small subunit [uncultured Fretibacterium sp.]|uniref:exodeoxyribonuclease VII small subunit n=1 Tax=uncultured Fretibacterium sp. TaxID=1678694 RepID=UPI0026073076|nr:exodeoxyribonuclease VII small subunit [uncultured Fretibacterium sp.]
MSFGDNLERLDEILRRLESEPMPLDEALEAFERGVSLVRESRGILERAEQRVTLLTQDGERPFEGSAGGENEKVEN